MLPPSVEREPQQRIRMVAGVVLPDVARGQQAVCRPQEGLLVVAADLLAKPFEHFGDRAVVDRGDALPQCGFVSPCDGG